MYEKNKIKSFSSSSHLFSFIIFLVPITIVSHFFDFLIYGIVIYLFVYIFYIIYSLYFFEKWIFSFKEDNNINYSEKYRNVVNEIKNTHKEYLLVKSKFNILEKRFKEFSKFQRQKQLYLYHLKFRSL